MKREQDVERGAAEERSDSPLTETEVSASQRPPSRGDQPAERQAEEEQADDELASDDEQ